MTDPFKDLQTVQISLTDEHVSGVDPEEKDLLQPHVDIIQEIMNKIRAGERVYLGITSGERKGSIAYVHSFNGDYSRRGDPDIRRIGYRNDGQVRIDNGTLYLILGWDKRRNKIQWSTHSNTVYLPDYEGPTVWQKVDKKKVAEAALKRHKVKDREGNVLKVGDRVIYINARYGSGARLDRGEISDIKMSVDIQGERRYVTVHVIIANDDGKTSDIRNPDLSILKTMSPMELASKQVLDF